MNPHDKKDLTRLVQAVEHSRWRLQTFREQRTRALKQFVGYNYSEDGATDKVPINLLELMINIYVRQLAARSPRVLVTGKQMGYKASAKRFQLGLNHLLKYEMNFESNLNLVVLDAMFGLGIMKVGITASGFEDADSVLHDSGQVYADPIHLDDWVHDMSVKRFQQCGYMGHRYRLPFEVAKQNFRNMEGLTPTDQKVYNEQGDVRAETLARGTESFHEEYSDSIELWDIWLARERVVITIPASAFGVESTAADPRLLNVVPYKSRESGPFHILSFNKVPSNVMPLSPSSLMMDLHELANQLFRKLGRQSERQKTLTAYRSGQENDAENVKDAQDGELIRVDDPKGVQTLAYGGIDQTNLAFLIQIKDMFAYFGGNLDALGGLGPQSETLGQDEMLAVTAGQRVSDMQDQTISYTRGVVNSIGREMWSDPLLNMELMEEVTENFSIPFTYTPEMREGDFFDYIVDIEPYSMQHNTPGRRLRTLTQVMSQYVAPLMPFMQASGMSINFEKLFKVIAEYADLPELEEVLEFVGRDSFAQNGEGGSATNPNTTHTSTRVNRPGATRQGKDTAMTQLLLGGNPQPAEQAAIMRPTG